MPRIPRLPVPELAETGERYLKQVRPLLSPEDYNRTAAALRYFLSAKGKGRILQKQLIAFDAQAKRSWLIDAWLESYLSVRTPLPLASNVGFELALQGKSLAEWASALSSVCALYRQGKIKMPPTPQGSPLCTEQWRILQGAARIPQKGCDGYRFAEGSRHIGIFHRGFYYRMAALDEQGLAYPPDTFRQAFEALAADSTANPYPVALPSYLGSEAAARVCRNLAQNPANAYLLSCMEEDLFHISLTDEPLGEDADLAEATFQSGQNLWCYKPATYCYNKATGRLFLHCEHTWQDGGALKSIVEHAAAAPASASKAAAPEIRRRAWALTAAMRKKWPQWQQSYAARAQQMRLSTAFIPFEHKRIPQGISQDALMQFLLQYAQLTTYGIIRNTYEAVDASHFQSGRTECVRPVSQESLAFVLSLLQEKPDRTALEAALAEHKARVKAAKLGRGANRHLLGLYLMSRQTSSRLPVFFKTAGYRTFTADFLSTSTLGDDKTVTRFAFAPTLPGGLGINYTLAAGGWRFTVSHTADRQQEAGVFTEALKLGGRQLLAFLHGEYSG